MKLATTAKVLATGLALLMLVFDVVASDPIFVKWLVIDDPGDETIRLYWQRAEAGELSAPELVDLGTMLFYRGWPNNAVDYFKQALKMDKELSEAWFRMGLVEHHSGDLAAARSAYKKCLKLQSGHAWANFYLALLEEQSGDASAAMKHFETAFQHAPELADPRINPEILSSRLQLGAQVEYFDSERFEKTMPMPFLDPAEVRKTRRRFEQTPTPNPAPEPTPVPRVESRPSPTPDPGASGASRGSASRQPRTSKSSGATGVPDAGSTPYGVPVVPTQSGTGTGKRGGSTSTQIGDTSPEASLGPLWPGLYRIAIALI
jgi:outer membrane biosynthesis protein TonB